MVYTEVPQDVKSVKKDRRYKYGCIGGWLGAVPGSTIFCIFLFLYIWGCSQVKESTWSPDPRCYPDLEITAPDFYRHYCIEPEHKNKFLCWVITGFTGTSLVLILISFIIIIGAMIGICLAEQHQDAPIDLSHENEMSVV